MHSVAARQSSHKAAVTVHFMQVHAQMLDHTDKVMHDLQPRLSLVSGRSVACLAQNVQLVLKW